MEKITKEELAANLDLDDLAEKDLANVVGGEESEGSVKKCMEACMKTLRDHDRCLLQCKYSASS